MRIANLVIYMSKIENNGVIERVRTKEAQWKGMRSLEVEQC